MHSWLTIITVHNMFAKKTICLLLKMFIMHNNMGLLYKMQLAKCS